MQRVSRTGEDSEAGGGSCSVRAPALLYCNALNCPGHKHGGGTCLHGTIPKKEWDRWDRYRQVSQLAQASPQSGKKFDSGKPPLAQGCFAYFGKALAGVAEISAYGAQKYSVPYNEQNWRKVENGKGRYADALLRHLKAHLSGELIDAESGKAHIDMVSWNALALSELEKA